MRICCLLFATSLPLAAAENAQELVRKAIENYQRDAQSALRYTYTTTDHSLKGVEVTQVMPLEGTPFERVIAKNGHPLAAEEEQRQQEKYDAAAKQRAGESPAARERRIRKYRDQSNFLRDVPEAFDFTMLREDTIDGRANYVVQCVAKPDYEPHDAKSRMFAKLTAKIWIDKQDIRMAKAEAEIVDTIAFGFIMARICKGGHIELTQKRIAEDVWLPKNIDIIGTARILLVDDKKVNEQITFDGFKPVSHAAGKELAQTAIR
jgi:hypothetical protein